MKTARNARIAPQEVRTKLTTLLEQHGESWLVEHIGCSSPTLARLMAGMGVMPPVLRLAQTKLERMKELVA